MHEPVDSLRLLPAEIWTECWAYSTPRQLRRISVVCRLFRSISLPSLFQHQSLDLGALLHGLTPDNWMHRFHHMHRSAVRLDSLAASPLVAFVRSWRVIFPSFPPSWRSDIKHIKLLAAMYERAVSRFWASLTLYRNVSTLHIQTFQIDAGMWETLLLPMLETLHLDAHFMVSGERTRVFLAEPWSQLRSLHLSNADHLNTFPPRYLHLLVDLSIQTINDMRPFIRFVAQCPQLEYLTVDSPGPPSARRSYNVPPSALPRLHTLAGPAYLIRTLVSNRPIRSARVVDVDMISNDLGDLLSTCLHISHSAVPVHAVAMPPAAPTLDFLRKLVALFPDLREVSLMVTKPMPYASFKIPRPGHGGRPQYGVDRRVPVLLDDADAFDDLPVEELSDNEGDNGSVHVLSEGFRRDQMAFITEHIETILTWIFEGSLDLPPTIELLRLECVLKEELPLVKQQQALVSLCARYACLREVQIGGCGTVWRRRSGASVWQAEGKSAVRIAVGPENREPVHTRES
ncbi:hypothetical protein C8R45DRAFT_1142895 [Mycena sanguinolenta]|nr:hypothetical protein C8R45DRAFT_1142895 [Mycena sanguinolenta]